MANVLVEESSLSAIANAIRGRNGTETTYTPGEMATAIEAIPTGSLQSKTVTPSASQQSVVPDSGYYGLSSVTVEAIPYTEEDNASGGKTVTIGGV